jgi:hypothetical protein
VTPDALAALNRRDDRQDQRLDKHGEKIKSLETDRAVMWERIEQLTKSVDRLTAAIYTGATAIVVSATAVIWFGGGG